VARPEAGARRLLRSRNFTLLWTGDALSQLGSQAATVALPLLVLSLTGSAAQAGLVGFARSVAYPLSSLPAGVLVDRLNRRAVMIGCDLGRAVAMASIPIVLALGRPPLGQLLVVAFLDAALVSVSLIAERGLLPQIVPEEAFADAVVLNEARVAIASVGGPSLGGALFGLARGLPFVVNVASFAASALAAAGVRVPRGPARPAGPSVRDLRAMRREIREGASWLWHQPFLRAGSLLYAAANLTLGAVELLGVLVARHHGASSAAIGLAFAIAGAGGIVSALVAGPMRRRVSSRWAVLAEPWFDVIFMPVLLLCRSGVAVGCVIAVMFLPMALSSGVVVGQRLALTPDHLRGRVQASASFLSGTIAWLGPLAVGIIFQSAGETAAVLAVTGWTLVVALGATLAKGFRLGPSGGVKQQPV
jgi:hypothetical protein